MQNTKRMEGDGVFSVSQSNFIQEHGSSLKTSRFDSVNPDIVPVFDEAYSAFEKFDFETMGSKFAIIAHMMGAEPEEPAKEECVDTPDWSNSNTWKSGCEEYNIRFCDKGKARPGMEWSLGSTWNFPENNCCSCGKN